MSTAQNNAASRHPEPGLPGDAVASTAGNGNGGRRQTPMAGAAIRQLRSGSDLAEVQLSEGVVQDALGVRRQQLENADRRSERESGERKEGRRLTFALALAAIIAVVGITVFLVIYGESGLLGYILSGIGGIIAGAFGGYGYANRRR